MERAQEFSEARYISLETYRRSGVGVPTTVWVVANAGFVYVRTGARSGKARRIRRNPRVRIARTNLRGEIQGDWVEGVARFVDGEDSKRILGLFREKYGLQLRFLGWLGKIAGSQESHMVVLGIELA